jgi:hypothetical protein
MELRKPKVLEEFNIVTICWFWFSTSRFCRRLNTVSQHRNDADDGAELVRVKCTVEGPRKTLECDTFNASTSTHLAQDCSQRVLSERGQPNNNYVVSHRHYLKPLSVATQAEGAGMRNLQNVIGWVKYKPDSHTRTRHPKIRCGVCQ